MACLHLLHFREWLNVINLKRTLYHVFFWLLACSFGYAQMPFIHNYNAENAPDFEVCFEILQAQNGLMYFGARNGLYTYDGYRWEVIQSVKNTARAIAQDKNGTIFIGMQNDFGYLEILPTGVQSFISLSPQFTEEEKKLPTIWDINIAPEGVWVRAQRFVYYFQKQGNTYKKTASYPAFGDVILSFFIEGKLYTTEGKEEEEENIRLFCYENGQKTLLTTNKHLNFVHAMFALSKDKLLLVSKSDGFLVYNKLTKSIVLLPDSPEQDLLRKANVYEFTSLKNGNFAFATQNEGILIFSPTLQLLHKINESTGLQNNNIHTIQEDAQGNLWAGVGQGISKIALSTPFLLYNKYAGISDKVYDLLEYQNTRYLATNSGVYYWENDKFQFIEGTNSQCWNIFPYKEGLMVGGGNSGAFYIEKKKLINKLAVTNSIMRLVVSKRDSAILYAATYGGVRIFKFQDKQFIDLGLIKATETDCRSVVELSDGRVWIGTTGKGFFLITFPQGYTTPEGVANALTTLHTKGLRETERNRVFENSLGVFFTSKTGLYQFNYTQKEFELYSKFSFDYTLTKYNSPLFREDKAGNMWFLNAKTILKQHTHDSTSLLPISKNINGFFEIPSENKVLLTTADGVYCYNKNQPLPAYPYPTKLVSISFSSNDSLLPLQGRQGVKISYSQNSLLFKFAGLSFFVEKENEFQYKLENYDTHWSVWTKLPQKEYTNLREGTYTFRVKSRNSYGQYGQQDTYVFTVLPPWYRTIYAYIGYFVASIALIWLVVVANTHRLNNQKRRLENIVKERTAELEQQKEEILAIAENLKQANAEITNQNKNTTASINYAKRIQNAILPFDERISQTFKEYFIFYEPRDIVSGDFYFFENNDDNILIASVDCTGHGVPGAFMSMIGTGLLNDIVNKQNIYSPDLILNELHKGIRYALKQKETQNNDGMDIGIVVVDKKFQTLTFAGAKNSLIYFRNNEMAQIKGDKLLIGGEQREIERIFTKQTISIIPDKGDNKLTFYLFSDGIHDQFGGSETKKYSSKKLKNFLSEIYQDNIYTQKELIKNEFLEWKGNNPQTDDVMLIGVRLELPML